MKVNMDQELPMGDRGTLDSPSRVRPCIHAPSQNGSPTRGHSLERMSGGVGLPSFRNEPLYIFEFDGVAVVRCINRSAVDLCQSAAPAGVASLGRTFCQDGEVLAQLRAAAHRCSRDGAFTTELELGDPLQRLSLHVTESSECSRYLLVATPKMCARQDHLTRETVAAIAHHIRNPMAGVRGAVEVIGAELGQGQADLKGVVGQITQRIDALDRALDAMLMYLHPRPPVIRHVDLRALLEELLSGDRPLPVPAARIQLTCEEAVLAADPDQITRAVLELVVNAVEARSGGETSVSVALTVEPPSATIRVANTAEIPVDLVARACEPFVTTKPRALGLGLTNARNIARAHGGDLSLTVADGETIVQLKVPLEHNPPSR